MHKNTRKTTNLSFILLLFGMITLLSSPVLAYTSTSTSISTPSYEITPKAADNETVLNLVMISWLDCPAQAKRGSCYSDIATLSFQPERHWNVR